MHVSVLQSEVAQVLRDLMLPGPWRGTAFAEGDGFSGAFIWQVESPAGHFCLKAWPGVQFSAARLQQMHQWMLVARESGLDFVPACWRSIAASTLVTHAEYHWDLTSWMPGAAVPNATTEAPKIRAACAALGQLHAVWRQGGTRRVEPESVQRRWSAAQVWSAEIDSGWQPNWSRVVVADAVQTLRSIWEYFQRALPTVALDLRPWLGQPQIAFPCLCDIWRPHVLFADERVTGMIDYGSMRVDTPAADVARLLGSITSGEPSLWHVGVDAYRRVCDFSIHEERLARVLYRTGFVGAAATWLDWLVRQPRPVVNTGAILRRLGELDGHLAKVRWDQPP